MSKITKTKLYNGEVELVFDGRPYKHIYTVDDRVVYGVTSIIGVLDKPALMYWAVNMAGEYLQENLKPGVALDEIEIGNLIKNAKSAHRQKKDSAADIGTMGHKWLESYVKAKLTGGKLPALPVNKDLRNGIRGFLTWVKENNVQFLTSEQQIYSREFHYAGTYDLDAIVNGKKTIVDFKFASGIYDEYFIQGSSYLKAKEEETGERYDGGVVVLKLSKKADDKSPFEVGSIGRIDADDYFDTFLSCLQIYTWRMRMKRDKMVKEVTE